MKHLIWTCLTNTVNGFQSLTVFRKKLHLRSLIDFSDASDISKIKNFISGLWFRVYWSINYIDKEYIYNSNGKDLTVVFKMGLSRAINLPSLICKLKLLEFLIKMVKPLKFMLQLQVSKRSEIADCLRFLRRLFFKCEIPICSAALNKNGVLFCRNK